MNEKVEKRILEVAIQRLKFKISANVARELGYNIERRLLDRRKLKENADDSILMAD